MSSKTRTRKTTTTTTTTTTGTTGSGSTLRSVPDQDTAAKVRTDTEDKLWEALHANPNSTAADLSAAAKIGKSTAQKILVKWAAEGSVTRTVTRVGFGEGGRRAADLWAITEIGAEPVDQGSAVPAEDIDSAGTTQDSPVAPDEAEAATPPAKKDATHTTVAEPVDAESVDQGDLTPAEDVHSAENAQAALDSPDEAAAITPTENDNTPPVNTETTNAADNETEETDPAQAEPVAAEQTDAADDGAETAADTATGGKGNDKERLAPGALRGMVEDFMRDHPGQEFGPTAIAKELAGKSSGAVSNALDKLVEDGVAVKTQDKPRRFALAPAETTAPAPTN
ncbi:MarR family transcriptional regulator [Solihabitans fulvus]|uniref:MarR family transcriptional regulator n=1 Tax=Solihabitans fulvus TaxID=1892852 RepID=A0A5B2WMN2_9PSEU|nr:MarR family transcriptional regulator [Solihabitans fulvus]KAA2253293.1 MarR family transcriptional regulator [Solihabitans fulvus]